MPRKTPLFGFNLFYHDEPIISSEDVRPGSEYNGATQPDAQNTLNFNFKRMDFVLQSIIDGTIAFNSIRTTMDVVSGRDVIVGRNLVVEGALHLPRDERNTPHIIFDFGDALVHAGTDASKVVTVTRNGATYSGNDRFNPFTPASNGLQVLNGHYPLVTTVHKAGGLIDPRNSNIVRLLVAFDKVPQNLSAIVAEFSYDGSTYPYRYEFTDEKATGNRSFLSDTIVLANAVQAVRITFEGTNASGVNFSIERIAVIAEGLPALEEFYLSRAGGNVHGDVTLARGDLAVALGNATVTTGDLIVPAGVARLRKVRITGTGSSSDTMIAAGQDNTGINFNTDAVSVVADGSAHNFTSADFETSTRVTIRADAGLIRKSNNTGSLVVSGGSNATTGSNVLVRGNAGGALRYNSSTKMSWTSAGVQIPTVTDKTSFNAGATLKADSEVEANLSVTGNQTVGGTFTVTGAAELASTLLVTGASTFTGIARFNNSTTQFGASTATIRKTSTSGTLQLSGSSSTTTGALINLRGSTNSTKNGNLVWNNLERLNWDADGINIFGDTTANGELAVTGNTTIGGNLTLNQPGNASNLAVRADRAITAGDGLTGGGNLTANRSFAVDDTVVRTSGNQSIGGTKTFTSYIRTGASDNVESRITRSNTNGFLALSGGTTWNDGAIVRLYGESHSSSPSQGLLLSGTASIARWSSTGFHVVNSSNVVLTDRTITAGDGLTGGGTLASNRSLAVDSTVVRTSGNQTISGNKTFMDNIIVDGYINRVSNTSTGGISGGTASNVGGNILLYGGDSSAPSRGALRSDSTQIARWDSDGFHVLNSSNVVLTSNPQSISGIKTFSSIPVLPSTNPTTADQATRKGYVDTLVNSGHTHDGTNGAKIQAGNVLATPHDSSVHSTNVQALLNSIRADFENHTHNGTDGNRLQANHVRAQTNSTSGFNTDVQSRLHSLQTQIENIVSGEVGFFDSFQAEEVLVTETLDATSVSTSMFAGANFSGNIALSGGSFSVNSSTVFNTSGVMPSTAPLPRAASGFLRAKGTSTAPAYEALVAADIPNLNTSKLNAGTLGVARGGTGRGTITSGTYMVGNGTSAVTMRSAADVMNDVGANRTITAGDGLSGGGTLAANRSLAVDSTVVRTSGNQTIDGTKDFTAEYTRFSGNISRLAKSTDDGLLALHGSNGSSDGASIFLGGSNYSQPNGRLRWDGTIIARWDSTGFHVDNSSNVVLTSRSISTGDGLSGGGNLTANRSLAVDSTVVRTSGNQTIAGVKTFTDELVLSANSIRSYNNSSTLNLYGGNSSSNGAGVWLRGGSHASDPGVGSLRANGSAVAYWNADGFHVSNSSNVVLTSGAQSMSGTKTFSSIPVLPSTNPSAVNHAVRKKYVDDLTVNAGDGLNSSGTLGNNATLTVDNTVVRTAGTQSIAGNKTFTGALTFSGSLTVPTPSSASHAVTKKYVDDIAGTIDFTPYATLAGDNTFTGNTNTFNGKLSIGHDNPTSSLDVLQPSTSASSGVIIRSSVASTNVAGRLWAGSSSFVIDALRGDLDTSVPRHIQFHTGGTAKFTIHSDGGLRLGGSSGAEIIDSTGVYLVKNNVWNKDRQGNERFYVGNHENSSGFVFRHSNASANFDIRSPSNTPIWQVNSAGSLSTGIVPWARITGAPDTILNRGSLGTTNLNTLGSSHIGIWHQTSNSNATTARMYPQADASGTLLVLPSYRGVMQVYITFSNGRMYTRGLTGTWNGSNGPWETWRTVNTAASLLTGQIGMGNLPRTTASHYLQSNGPDSSPRWRTHAQVRSDIGAAPLAGTKTFTGTTIFEGTLRIPVS